MPNISTNEGLYRISGMYGHILMGGEVRAEITELTGAVEVNRVEIPLVGKTKQGYKPGRESREGTFRIQKIDSHWELEMFQYLSVNLETRRANRGTAAGALRPFTIQIHLDDPDALDREVWQLEGCLIWRMPLGFNITDDLVDREFPFTWEKEVPVHTFRVPPHSPPNDINGFPTIENPPEFNLTAA